MKTTTFLSPASKALCAFRAPGLLAALLLAGCSVLPAPTADPTRFYLLQGTAKPPEPATAAVGALRIGVHSIQLPPYLSNNRTMVVRSGVNEIRYEDYARWAEPLEAAVLHAVRERLLAAGGIATAETPPFSPDVRRDLDVTVRVLRCEGASDPAKGNTAQFEAVYEIADLRQNGQIVVRRDFKPAAAEWNGTDFAQLAAKLGDAAAALGNDIAVNLPR
ncbi:hypothetical protein DB347_12415 [Opitutaceae bacterium EW11]|nr:hypothetical protein DB347_12415 [Opitutaceae bacterium EW11]